MKNLKIFLILLVSCFLFCGFTAIAHASDEMQLYNRNEKVQLSKSLLYKNDDYFISVDDLSKINLKYNLNEFNNGYQIYISSVDSFGKENSLEIIAGESKTNNQYDFRNVMDSKKSRTSDTIWNDSVETEIGDFESVIVENSNYYISLKAISIAISYQYHVTDDSIALWITDENHHVIYGEIALPDGETAPENGIKVDILVLEVEDELIGHSSYQSVTILEGENKTNYFIETDCPGNYHNIMFEFEGNYQTINELFFIEKLSHLDVLTTPLEKIPFKIGFDLPGGLVAENDIYATILLNRCSVYQSEEPIIKKGDYFGSVTLNIDPDFYDIIAFVDISGDERIFNYGYYRLDALRFQKENAGFVSAKYHKSITVPLMQCYEISGQVIPTDINSGYKVEVFGVTNKKEKLYLYQTIGDNFKFSIKVPSAIPEYTLAVCYRPGVYCNYISDGVSSYSNKPHYLENICNYSDINLKYLPFLPSLPLDMSVSVKWDNYSVALRNLSDDLVTNIMLSCAFYKDGKLIDINTISIRHIMIYTDGEKYRFTYPKEFYKADEIRFFVTDNNLKPLAQSISKKVNQKDDIYEQEYYDVNPESLYNAAIYDASLSGIMVGYEDGRFYPEHLVMRSQSAVFMCRLLGYWGNFYEFSCGDIEKDSWESCYVGICVNENVFTLTDNQFRPNENITIAETYEAIQNILKTKNYPIDESALYHNINFTNSDRAITRAEFAQMLYNYKNYISSNF